MDTMPDGIHITNVGNIVAMKGGNIIAETYGPDDFSIYDWTETALLEEFAAKARLPGGGPEFADGEPL